VKSGAKQIEDDNEHEAEDEEAVIPEAFTKSSP